jgi:hypothetical protein
MGLVSYALLDVKRLKYVTIVTITIINIVIVSPVINSLAQWCSGLSPVNCIVTPMAKKLLSFIEPESSTAFIKSCGRIPSRANVNIILICTHVLKETSSFRVYRSNLGMSFSYTYACYTSRLSHCQLNLYLKKNTNYDAHYVNSSAVLTFPFRWVQIFSSAICSQEHCYQTFGIFGWIIQVYAFDDVLQICLFIQTIKMEKNC